jgi:hypothetical protein
MAMQDVLARFSYTYRGDLLSATLGSAALKETRADRRKEIAQVG